MKKYDRFFFFIVLFGVLVFIGCESNSSPDIPDAPTGPSSGLVNDTISFSVHTTDPDDDFIMYQFDWGDGSLSSWSGYVLSGDSLMRSYTYSSNGIYEVRVKAKDVHQAESDWSSGHSIAISEIPLGDSLWSFLTGGSVWSSPAVGDDGTIRVHRVYCVIDCGIAINPGMVAAQMESGIAVGLTAALKGEITFENGRVQQQGLRDYPLLRMDEMPEIQVHIIESSRDPQGVGEMGVPPIAPAMANAVFDATGIRVRHLPIEPTDLV